MTASEMSAKTTIAGIPCLQLTVVNEQGQARLSRELAHHWTAMLQELADVRFVVITGVGDTFCEGLDLDSLIPFLGTPEVAQVSRANFMGYVELLRALQRVPCPVISLVNGQAFGGGVGLAAVSDLVIASPHARFGLPEAIYGFIPVGVFPFLAHKVGIAKAKLLGIGGAPFSATDAWHFGLVDEVAADPQVAVRRHLQRLALMDATAVQVLKQVVLDHYPLPADYWEDASTRFFELFNAPDTQERLRRFLAGETPWSREDAP